MNSFRDDRLVRFFLLSILGFSILWFSRWPVFPLALDPYYHLFISKQMVQANGLILYEWWEYAPVGRPHLYPPLLHLLLAIGLKGGFDPITLLRLFSVSLMPMILISTWHFLKTVTNKHIALAGVWVGMVPLSFATHSAITLASSIAVIEILWLLVSIERGRIWASGILLSLLFYTHLGLPWIFLTAMFFYSFIRPGVRSVLIKSSWGFLLALPWLFHLLRNINFFHVVSRYENQALELNLSVYLLALVGLVYCVRRGNSLRVLIGLLFGFVLLSFKFSYRYFSAEGLVPLILLSAVGMYYLSDYFSSRIRKKAFHGSPISIMFLFWVICVFFPIMNINVPSGGFYDERQETQYSKKPFIELSMFDSLVCRLFSRSKDLTRSFESSFYSSYTKRLSETLEKLSKKDEILWSNAPYALGLVASLAGRPIATAMFPEVGAISEFDPIRAAHFVVWFKIDDMPNVPDLKDIIKRYDLKLVGEDEITIIFRNMSASDLAQAPQPFIRIAASSMLLFIGLLIVIWDLNRKRETGIVL